MIDFEWYRSFIAVYQSGTVSAAATQRMMTQPAISLHISALEKALGVPLFKRTPRQMQPTPEAQALYTRVIGAIEQLEMLSDPQALRHEKPFFRLRLGTPREYFLGRILPKLSQDDHQIQVVFGETRPLIRQLEADDLDVLIATQRIARRNLHYVPLESEHFVLVAHSQCVVPQENLVTWLNQQVWVAYALDLPIIRRYWQEVFHARPQMIPALILPDLLACLQAVQAQPRLSILPRYLCESALESGQLIEIHATNTPPTNELYIAVNRDKLKQPEIEWLLRQLQA
jgi:DNA-binding transcriptional LysR family regulator